MLQPMFSIVAKNADESDQTRFVQIIEETLQKLVKEGLNQDSLLAGINSAEFRSGKQITDSFRRDFCMDCSVWKAGCLMIPSRLFIWNVWIRYSFAGADQNQIF